jgi:archaellum biogenesis protein FlaJ (TadC family)
MSLVGYTSQTFTDMNAIHDDPSRTEWFEDFKRLISSVNVTSHEITSLLAILSSAITSGQPLPPYLTTPQPYQLSARIRSLDRDILSLRHIAEPGYAAFAVMQISTRCIVGDLEKLLK